MDDIFKKIIDREIPADIIYEDDDFIAILDINPVNPGHTLLIPKDPSKDILEMSDGLLRQIGPLIKKIGNAVKKALDADGLNIGINNGKTAGQVVFHTHIHIIPRTKEDGYELWHGKPYKEGEATKIAEKIKEAL